MFTKIIKTLNGLIERFTPRQLLLGAAALGLLVVLMVYSTLNHMEKSLKAEQPKPIKMTKAVVAKVDIPRGVVIQKNMLSVKEFVVGSLPEGSKSDVEEFINLPTKLEIFAGDVLTTEKVFTDNRQAGFVGMIPDNCRAVSIPVDNVSAIAGLIKAGDYVDLILILSAEGGMKSTVLLQNVLLLSINQNADRQIQSPKKSKAPAAEQPADKQQTDALEKNLEGVTPTEKTESQSEPTVRQPVAQNVGMVTLALKPDDITRVTAATVIGRIYLALRPLKPSSDSMFITKTDYYSATDSEEPPQPVRSTPPPQPLPVIPPAPLPKTPQPNLPVIPNNGIPPTSTPQAGGFEIIQWGK